MDQSRIADSTVDAGGATIPRVGLGTMELTGQACADIVKQALDQGYRHIDTAQEYGNERMVGEGIAAADIDREDVFLTTKVHPSNILADSVVDAVHASLDRLDVEYVDLLLIHGPHPRMDIEDTLTTMARLRAEGFVEHVGVSNFSRSLLRTALDVAEVPIVTNQVLYHPYRDQSDLIATCVDNDVALTAYSPLARGTVLGDDTLATIGRAYGKTSAQVALRWLIQQDGVAAIPRTSSPQHLAQNRDIFEFELTDEEVARIDALSPTPRQRLAYAIRRAMFRINAVVWNRR